MTMTTEELKRKLRGYTKDEIIEAILDERAANELIRALKRNRIDSLWDQECRAEEEVLKIKKDCDRYFFEIAEKYGIVAVNEEGIEDFNWDDWFFVTTSEERVKANSLKDDIKIAEERRESIRFKRRRLEEELL